jgi:hypothetical protein
MSALPSQRWPDLPEDPMRGFEPTAAQIADRAAYLLPLILKRHPEPSALIVDGLASAAWAKQADAALMAGDQCALGALMDRIRHAEARELSETLASAELHRADLHHFNRAVLNALRAGNAFEWLRERSL